MMAGELSDWYIGTRTDKAPIPKPLIRRPTANCAQEVDDEISMTVPTQLQKAHAEIEYLRPMMSASCPDIKEPKRHPAQRMAVIVPWRTAEKVYEPSAWSSPNR